MPGECNASRNRSGRTERLRSMCSSGTPILRQSTLFPAIGVKHQRTATLVDRPEPQLEGHRSCIQTTMGVANVGTLRKNRNRSLEAARKG